MIMLCMNSTSACERGGNLAFVDGGRVLVGWPGAPGCTTTGAEESRCCDGDGEEKKTTKAVTASKLQNRADFLAGRTSRRCSLIRFGCGFGAKLNLAY
jgi:hypothetical protein